MVLKFGLLIGTVIIIALSQKKELAWRSQIIICVFHNAYHRIPVWICIYFRDSNSKCCQWTNQAN